MKGNSIRSVLLFLLFHSILLKANAAQQLEAIVKATTNKGEGILAKVDTVFKKKWKGSGMKFRFYRSIKGADNYKILDEKWGTYQKFDVTATPGIWYQYKVEAREKGGTTFFLSATGSVEGYRPPSSPKLIDTDMLIPELYQYRGEIYIDFYFKGEDGGWILPNEAVYHIKYETQQNKGWMFDLGNGPLHPVYGEVETQKPRFRLKKLPGMDSIELCIRMIQNGKLSRFFCKTIKLEKIPHKRPNDIAVLDLNRFNGKKGVRMNVAAECYSKLQKTRVAELFTLLPMSVVAICRRSRWAGLTQRAA